MKIFFNLLLLLSLNTFAQSNLFEIEYVCTRTLNFKVQTNDVLYYNPDEKISFYKEGKYVELEAPKLPSENAVIISDDDNGNKNYVYTLFKENISYVNTKPFDLYYTYKEEIPKMSWNLTSETKNKDGIELTKATTNFRGRNYEVWFSYEYPISIGPWKFQGLPGLIFEVVDLSQPFNFHWQLKKITNKKGALPFTGKNLKNVLNAQNFLDKFKEEHMNYSDVIMLRSGVEYESISIEDKKKSLDKNRQLDREVKFEWED